MNKIDTVLVAFSATSIHSKLVIQALDVAEQNNAKLIILSVRDKNVAENVAKMAKNQGFLGKSFVENLKGDIIKDRDEVIARRLGMLEKEAEERGIVFETMRLKGDFVENVIDVVKKCGADVLLLENIGKKADEIKKTILCKVIIIQ